MKTLLYNPIFINPQAYYVFPRLTKYLQPDNESTTELANYIGTIEVKVIAYGDTNLKRTYTHTSFIDLSEFKNTWIRISLFTKVGSCVLGEWKIGDMETDLPYIEPEVLASLKAVVIVGDKTNNDPDRAIIKNLVDPDNPFVISNAAYTEGSGYADKGSPYYGAFVTDGINDLITSTKTVQEMLGGSNEITVVSMMANLDSRQILCNSNFSNTNGYNVRNTLEPNGVISMLGYTDKNGTTNNLNLIMGDKDSIKLVDKVNFNSDYVFYPAQYYKYYYQVAWYWTIIANKVLTTDQINQVIAYFNLDRTLKPDILCDVKKQGITNENHAEFGDKLIDFSGNGRDIQLNNIAWKGDSGIGKYETDFTKWLLDQVVDITRKYSSFNIKTKNDSRVNIWVVRAQDTVIPSMKVKVTGMSSSVESLIYRYSVIDDKDYYIDITSDGIYELPQTNGEGWEGFRIIGKNFNISVEQIPSHAGGLCLDGINDFGKVTGMPIYKDYTFIIDYERISYASSERWVAGVVSKSHVANQGAFILMTANTAVEPVKQTYSFGGVTSFKRDDFTRALLYQSKYKCGDVDLTAGEGVDSDTLWLGTFRDNDKRFFNGAIYSLMSFPYSMSEFLIERQLKKHKLGTLYPDMVEFRPVIKTNVDYTLIQFYINNYTKRIYPGDYIPINTPIQVNFYLKNNVDELISFKVNGNDSTFKRSTVVDNAYNIETLPITESPQKIDITIDEYIRYEDIVQPYPVLLRFKDENGNEVSWGGKFKVGSTITRIGSAADSNLLPNIYNIFGLLLNGNQVTSSKVIVEKTMVFKVKSAYIFDNNEPKCILSPRLLRIPNSSYKILGHIPDISGHGNHGKINNSAYASMSGANGYKQDFTSWKTSGSSYSIVTDSKYILTNEKAITNGGYFLWNRLAKDSFKVKISNIPNGGWMSYRYKITEEDTQFSSLFIRKDGIYTLPATIADSEVDFFISTVSAPAKDWIGLTIEQIGEYEGAYCLDGIDDFVTIPTLSSGGKQVLMKVNLPRLNEIIYDQRKETNTYTFAIITIPSQIAYDQRNSERITYIDGILNTNIIAEQLMGVTHNIVVINSKANLDNTRSPILGRDINGNNWSRMRIYDFMLFESISTDDKIKELNEYVGIEGNTEWRKTE